MGQACLKSRFAALAFAVFSPILFSSLSFAVGTVVAGTPVAGGNCRKMVNDVTVPDQQVMIQTVSQDQKTILQTFACPAGLGTADAPKSVPNPNAPKDQADSGGGGGGSPSGGDQGGQQSPQNADNKNGSPNGENPADEVAGADCSGGKPEQDMANQRDCQAASSIKQAVNALKAQVADPTSLDAAEKAYETAQKSCNSKHSTAASACLEGMSKDLSSGLAAVNGVLSAVNGASSNQSCSDMSKIMDMANKALTAFTGACGGTKAMCSSACGDAKTALNKLKSAAQMAQPKNPASDISALKSAVASSVEPELSTGDTTSVASKADLCNKKYKEQLASAATGIASMLAGLMQGDKCKDETAAATVNCSDPSQAQTPTCLCQANPRLPGCENALQKVGDGSGSVGISPSGATLGSPTAGTPSLAAGSEVPDFSRSPSNDAAIGGSSGAGAPIGGPSAGAAAASAGADGGGAGRGLNTNILAGTSGSGGGGGAWGAGGSSATGAGKYKDYLPGGAKDPNKLNGNAFANEITGQGKSNWDKIKDRYRDNKPTLLNN